MTVGLTVDRPPRRGFLRLSTLYTVAACTVGTQGVSAKISCNLPIGPKRRPVGAERGTGQRPRRPDLLDVARGFPPKPPGRLPIGAGRDFFGSAGTADPRLRTDFPRGGGLGRRRLVMVSWGTGGSSAGVVGEYVEARTWWTPPQFGLMSETTGANPRSEYNDCNHRRNTGVEEWSRQHCVSRCSHRARPTTAHRTLHRSP